ncbi:SDR family NAD(P)-dependent oxidoreductase [bacterium]|nr:SDR family NAD(P)-dependent oxidoreductase [bacterium]
MRLKKKRVLVTGGSGFIGSHLIQRLLAEGASVRMLSHYRSHPGLHNLEFLSSEERAAVEVIRGDIRDPFQVHSCVKDCDIVFHLASLIGIPYSYEAPSSYVQTNIQGALNVLEACRTEQTPRLVHTSTSECYGTASYTPIDEKHPLQGQSPYSATKIAADKLVESYYLSFEVKTVTVRPFNTFGPRQSARAVIPTIISQLLAGVSSLKLGDLSPVRDLTYVSDTVNGFICAAIAPDVEGELVNLGNSKGISIGDLAALLMKVTGIGVPVVSDEQRVRPEKSEVFELICNNEKAAQMINWHPQVSLEEGLVRTVEFIRQHQGEFRVQEYGV